MCTLSWIHTEGGYELFFNRDERLTRKPELAPSVVEKNSVRFIAPEDGDHGGTWIAANEYGVSLCLLNGNGKSRGAPRPEYTSRGLFLLTLVDLASISGAAQRLVGVDLSPYAPFVLAIFIPGLEACILEWDGRDRHLDFQGDHRMPLTSSGVDAGEVRRKRSERLRRFAAHGLTPDVLADFHASHLDGPSAFSACMHREDAETKSSSRVTVSRDETAFHHTPGAPCTVAPATPIVLPRVTRETHQRSSSAGSLYQPQNVAR